MFPAAAQVVAKVAAVVTMEFRTFVMALIALLAGLEKVFAAG